MLQYAYKLLFKWLPNVYPLKCLEPQGFTKKFIPFSVYLNVYLFES